MLKAGTIIGSYEILAPIGSGGMGVVYRGRHVMLKAPVAIKVLLANFAMRDKVRQRFQQEAYVQANLKHPNIVRATDMLVTDEVLGIVMELVEGPSLEDLLQDEANERWTVDEMLSIMIPVMDALAYAHSRGVVHRDLKPSNVLIDAPEGSAGMGIPKVVDFGLSKIVSSEMGMTQPGARMGTIPFMPPEQFDGETEIGPAADVYAIGMIIWRMLYGRLPVNPNNNSEVFRFYSGQIELPPLSAIAHVSDAFSNAVGAALSRDPSQRPTDAGSLVTALGLSSPGLSSPAVTRSSGAIRVVSTARMSSSMPPISAPPPNTPAPESVPEPHRVRALASIGAPIPGEQQDGVAPVHKPSPTEREVARFLEEAFEEENRGSLIGSLKLFRQALGMDSENAIAKNGVDRLAKRAISEIEKNAQRKAVSGEMSACKELLDQASRIASAAPSVQEQCNAMLLGIAKAVLSTAGEMEEAGRFKEAKALLESAQESLGPVPGLREQFEALDYRIRKRDEAELVAQVQAHFRNEEWAAARDALLAAKDEGVDPEVIRRLVLRVICAQAEQALESGDAKRARSHLEQAREIDGNNSRVKYLFAKIVEQEEATASRREKETQPVTHASSDPGRQRQPNIVAPSAPLASSRSDASPTTRSGKAPLAIVLVFAAIVLLFVALAGDDDGDSSGIGTAPPQQVGHLVITSDTDSASISIDGRVRERSVASGREIRIEQPPGRYEVAVTRDGWTTFRQTVRVSGSGDTRVTATLHPLEFALPSGVLLRLVERNPSFYAEVSPTTVGEFRECVRDSRCQDGVEGKYRTRRDSTSCNYRTSRRHAGDQMNCLSADAAAAYCGSLGMRLPTSAELETVYGSGSFGPVLWEWTSTPSTNDRRKRIVRSGRSAPEGPDNVDSRRGQGAVRATAMTSFVGVRCVVGRDTAIRQFQP